MHLDTPGKRVQFLREHFGLDKPKFVKILGSSLATIYRVEGDHGKGPSENFLNALKVNFLANPDWIKTGEGDMFIEPEEYLDKGIEILGNERFSKGIISVLKDPRYAELQAFIKMEDIGDKIDGELRAFLLQMIRLWKQGDKRLRKAMLEFVKGYLGEEGNKK
jgi:hypothetical protein